MSLEQWRLGNACVGQAVAQEGGTLTMLASLPKARGPSWVVGLEPVAPS